TIEKPLTDTLLPDLRAIFDQLLDQAIEGLGEQFGDAGQVHSVFRVHLKYQGTDTALDVEFNESPTLMTNRFEQAYRRRYSFLMPGRPLIVESVSVQASLGADAVTEPAASNASRVGDLVPRATRPMYS